MMVDASPWPREPAHPFAWSFQPVAGDVAAPRPAGFTTAWRRLPTPLLESPVSGSWRLELAGGARLDVVPGQAVVLPAETLHRLVAGPRGVRSTWALLRWACGTDLDLVDLLAPPPRLPAPDGGRIAELLAEVLAHLTGASAGRVANLLALERSGLDLLALLAVHGCSAVAAPPPRDRRLATVQRHIADHLDGPIAVRDLAEAAGVSASRLHQIVLAATGRTPLALIDEARFRRARLLLATTDDTAAAIAARCGFADAGYFTRWFGRQAGLPPAAWRRSLRPGTAP